MSLVEAIRKANRPGPPENSIRVRVACTATVLVSIAAAVAEHEMARNTGVLAGVLIAAAMTFSYRTRRTPPGWVKISVAVGAVASLLWFLHQVGSGPLTDITTVENPLTVLFAAILVVHSFHVPARRDLMFALVASAALMAIGGAQAIDLSFGFYAVAWIACGVWCLLEMWSSASEGGRVSPLGIGSSVMAVSLASALLFLLLPAPVVAIKVDFAARAGPGGPVGIPGARAGDVAGSPSQLSKPGSPAGPTRVGGYLGFAGSLDTAVRGRLGHTLVMRVRATRPSYWVGETYDQWDGQSWNSTLSTSIAIPGSSPFSVPTLVGEYQEGGSDLQTFYVNTPTADLIFHADSAQQVWFPSSTIYYARDDSIVSPIGLGRGAIYTVQSSVVGATPDQLRRAGAVLPDFASRYLQLPHAYPQAAALARAVTAGAPDNYDRIQSLIAWMGANTRYSTDIPPLPAGADTVDEFLFGDRVGFCEQISTALAVMLRSLGIPAREVVGYVPGSYDPVTDLYQVRADDAHAWVQVWFPGWGWQSFDPTANVPLANPSPGGTALRAVGRALGRAPLVPIGISLVVAAVLLTALRIRRRRPATWAERLARRIERSGRRRGRPRRSGETLAEYAGALDGTGGDRWRRLAAAAEASAYGDQHPPPEERRELLAAARRGG